MKRGNLKQVRESYSGVSSGKNGLKVSFFYFFRARRDWSDDEIKTLFRLHSEGVTYKQIAFILSRTVSSVHHKILRLGLSRYSSYTPEEHRIISFYAGKKSASEIGELIGRSARSVNNYSFRNRILLYRYSDYHQSSKLTDEDVFLIRALYSESVTTGEIADKFDVSPRLVRHICYCDSPRKCVADYYLAAERFKYIPFRKS